MHKITSGTESATSLPKIPFHTILRFFGVALIFIGIGIGYKVIDYSWKLLEDPKPVADFSEKIENYAKINENLKKLLATGIIVRTNQANNNQTLQTTVGGQNNIDFNVSYFTAWGINIMLLLAIGNIACNIISSGGKIAASSDFSNEFSLLVKKLNVV